MPGRSIAAANRLGRWLVWSLWPNQRLRWTREGWSISASGSASCSAGL